MPFPFGTFVPGLYGGFLQYSSEQAKTSNYQIVYATDNGKLFTNYGAAGAVTFTLPAVIAANQRYVFKVIAQQQLTITSFEGSNIVAQGNAAASSITITASAQEIGSHVVLETNAAGTLWYATYISAGAQQNLPSAVSATGTTQGGAAALAGGVNLVTGSNGTAGVILPTPVPGGSAVRVKNSGTGILLVYPPTGDTIDSLAANTAQQLPVNSIIEYLAATTTGWYSIAYETPTNFTPVTVAGAGTTQGNAAALTAGVLNIVSGGNGTVGVILPTPTPGNPPTIIKSTGTGTLLVYPPTGDTINASLANTAYTMGTATIAAFYPGTTAAYYSHPLVAS
jgi:hypothetical protein